MKEKPEQRLGVKFLITNSDDDPPMWKGEIYRSRKNYTETLWESAWLFTKEDVAEQGRKWMEENLHMTTSKRFKYVD